MKQSYYRMVGKLLLKFLGYWTLAFVIMMLFGILLRAILMPPA